MRAYEQNRINVEPGELPLDTTIGARVLSLVPAYRSGVIARFPVKRARGAVFTLLNETGVPLLPGSEVQVGSEQAVVALDGQVYVADLVSAAAQAGTASWSRGRCQFNIPSLPANDPLPDLGPVTCRAEAPVAP
jgi:outer membrane usher protein